MVSPEYAGKANDSGKVGSSPQNPTQPESFCQIVYMLHKGVLFPARLVRQLSAYDGIVQTRSIHHAAHVDFHCNRTGVVHVSRPAIVRKPAIQPLIHLSFDLMERCQRRIVLLILSRMPPQIDFCNVHLLSGMLPCKFPYVCQPFFLICFCPFLHYFHLCRRYISSPRRPQTT